MLTKALSADKLDACRRLISLKKNPHARVKGEFVGKLVPPNGNQTSWIGKSDEEVRSGGSDRYPETGPDGSGRYLTEFGAN